jgi:hypothetical protein
VPRVDWWGLFHRLMLPALDGGRGWTPRQIGELTLFQAACVLAPHPPDGSGPITSFDQYDTSGHADAEGVSNT